MISQQVCNACNYFFLSANVQAYYRNVIFLQLYKIFSFIGLPPDCKFNLFHFNTQVLSNDFLKHKFYLFKSFEYGKVQKTVFHFKKSFPEDSGRLVSHGKVKSSFHQNQHISDFKFLLKFFSLQLQHPRFLKPLRDSKAWGIFVWAMTGYTQKGIQFYIKTQCIGR